MRCLIQRVNKAQVIVNKKIISSIDKGILIFVGFSNNDNKYIIEKMADKLLKLRIFEDNEKKMNLDINDINGKMLIVSQFTLYGNLKKGNRPSFDVSMDKEDAKRLYDYFINILKKKIHVEQGVFGEYMQVNLTNDGPVTFLLEY